MLFANEAQNAIDYNSQGNADNDKSNYRKIEGEALFFYSYITWELAQEWDMVTEDQY